MYGDTAARQRIAEESVVPPYNAGVLTISSPAWTNAKTVLEIAAIPDAKRAADSPSSINAIFSSTSCTVGLW